LKVQIGPLLLLPEDISEELPFKIEEEDIRRLVRKYSTHPAIALGRLQHQRILPYTFGNSLKVKVKLEEFINKSQDYKSNLIFRP
jgi:hypothetical protein